MNNRWKMNRIGFVNFWLYDEEYFEFCDGKLLLRGQNGSGKSITTQSFIPFILDGDRTPSRLDPFGSSDRRMDYYLLGEEEKDEATGYLFLELKKEHTEEFRTIGIGQRAKRGKPMDFWGFVILDGRRIGYDMWLYKETGSTKIPYDKREIRTELGESNLYTDSQSEYKKLVNQYIFGFRKAEQYEQFIKLLVKVRAPKLSKEFKPTKVYDILNESLQTLSDEDLRSMVDAMEKMDEIQDSLEMLNRAFSDVKAIKTEYDRYNRYMLGKKAQSYLKKKEEVEIARQEYETNQTKKNEYQMDLKNINDCLEELLEKEKLAETERNGLLDTDLEEIDRRLEVARKQKEQAQEKECKLESKIQEYKDKIRQKEQELQRIKENLEECQYTLTKRKIELEEQQEILQWEEHENVLRFIEAEKVNGAEEISNNLFIYKKIVEECSRLIHAFEEILCKYDEVAEELEGISKKKSEREQKLSEADRQVLLSQDDWIAKLYSNVENSQYWKPQESILRDAEEKIRKYQNIADAEKIQGSLRKDYESQRAEWFEKKQKFIQLIGSCEDKLDTTRRELEDIQNKEEIEPCRSEKVLSSRKRLKEVGIETIPFYKTVEFVEGLEETACAQLEAQLESMGLLDALVVSEKDYGKIVETCPEFYDTVVYVPTQGSSNFSKLVINDDLESEIKESVRKILSNIYEKHGAGNGIYLGENGQFVHGILAGRSGKTETEFLGYLTRQKKKAQRIAVLQKQMDDIQQEIQSWQDEIKDIEQCMEKLEYEYKNIPDFNALSLALEYQKNCSLELECCLTEYSKIEKKERDCADKKQTQYQLMLQKCKSLPYGRTESEYSEVLEVLEEYRHIWQQCKELLLMLETERGNYFTGRDYLGQDEQILDDIFVEKRSCNIKVKEYHVQICQYEEYLNRPEMVERARRLEELREETENIQTQKDTLKEQYVRVDQNLQKLMEDEPKNKEKLQELIAEETILRKYFEEELSLKLVVERETRTLTECGGEAIGLMRENDKKREYGDMLQTLIQVYQKHNGSLSNYGTSLEDCFGTVEEWAGVGTEFNALRKRVCVVSAWNGKKVFLEEFYHILKAAIDETELLIQQKDRELFEDILSQTISQQLTDRIAESRGWVRDMSNLMKELDTSMGLSFSLDWKPRSAENDTELDIVELEKILLRDRDLLTMEDIEKVAGHFRTKIRVEKMKLEEDGGPINYMELIRDALDYRKWFEFRMFYKKGEENRKPLTNAAFNRFSGGEKAMAMYVPLFAAVNAQYKKADYVEHPRMIALDEAFAGVDDKNISSMFELVHKMEFDYIMNSQSLWGCYETVKGIKIAELHRPMNSQIVTVIRYIWNGHERILDVQ